MKVFRKLKCQDIVAVLFILAILTLVYFSTPGKSVWLPKCMFNELTGLYCSGCGMTRSMHSLLHLDIIGSLRNNILALPFCLCTLSTLLLDSRKIISRCWIFFCIAAIVFMILRNIPVYPFTLLAPIPFT